MKQPTDARTYKEENILRHRPQQERSQQRVNAILDAAEQLFAGIGYEATSTNAIAARAHVSIGSLYQFFASKEAILQSAIFRCRDQVHTISSTILTDDFFSPPLDAALDRLLAAFIDLHTVHKGTFPFYVESPLAQQTCQEMFDRLDQLLARAAPTLSSVQRKVAAQLIFRTSQAVLAIAYASEKTEQKLLLDGLKVMLISYLNPLLTTEQPAH